jgi:O-antigen ligase
MFLQKTNIYSKNNLINLLIFLIPISFIAGNLVLNLNIILFSILALTIYGKEILKIKFNFFDKLILLFFLYIFCNGIYNNFFNFDFPKAPEQNLVLKKSIFYLRFLILYFVLRFLIKEKLIIYKFLFLSLGACSVFVSIDLIIQYFFGMDLLGFEISGRRMSGPFGDEHIAGSFIQRFWIFSIFSIILFFQIRKNIMYPSIFFFLIIITTIGIILSGNRVPFLMFSIMLVLLFIFQKELRKTFIVLFFLISIFLSYIFNSNDNIKGHYDNFIFNSNQIIIFLKSKLNNNEIIPTSRYTKEFENGFLTWETNKYFGGGIKSFYWNCSEIKVSYTKILGGISCNSHPHNYYLENLTELGLIGFFLVSFLFLCALYKCIKFYIHINNASRDRNLIFPFIIIFIVEIFPLKTTGSFFTTANSTFLFFIIAFVIGLSEYKKSK